MRKVSKPTQSTSLAGGIWSGAAKLVKASMIIKMIGMIVKNNMPMLGRIRNVWANL
ncbi:hypothetical protein D3C86_2145560 [compost metagenome]